MKAYQQRVQDEKDELDTRISKLCSFCLSKAFRYVNLKEQERLIRQVDVMTEYSEILGERISAF